MQIRHLISAAMISGLAWGGASCSKSSGGKTEPQIKKTPPATADKFAKPSPVPTPPDNYQAGVTIQPSAPTDPQNPQNPTDPQNPPPPPVPSVIHAEVVVVPSAEMALHLSDNELQVGAKVDDAALEVSATMGERMVPPPGNVASAILIDDSGSIQDTDPLGAETKQGARRYFSTLKGGEVPFEVAVFKFRTSDKTQPQAIEKILDFTNDQSSLDVALTKLTKDQPSPALRALNELIDTMAKERPDSSLRRSIVFFSDGMLDDDDTQKRQTLCDKARRWKIPIFAIGFGPGSRLQPWQGNPHAIDFMESISTCSRGIYSPVDPVSSEAIQTMYANLGAVQTRGGVRINLTIKDKQGNAITPGKKIRGRITLSSGTVRHETVYEFLAP